MFGNGVHNRSLRSAHRQQRCGDDRADKPDTTNFEPHCELRTPNSDPEPRTPEPRTELEHEPGTEKREVRTHASTSIVPACSHAPRCSDSPDWKAAGRF